MTDYPISAGGYADPSTEAFWKACADRRLTVQRCTACGHHQMYPRPMCLKCGATELSMVEASGNGTVYSVTTMRIPVTEALAPPYLLALIDLDEGPRLLSNIESDTARIGDRVCVAWRDRKDAPPVPVFRHAGN